MANVRRLLEHTSTAVDRLSAALDRFSRWTCIALVLFMTVEVVTAVFFRYVLFAPFRWAEEVARTAMVWFGMFGIAVALHDGDHVALDTLLRRLRSKARAATLLLAYLCVGVFLVVLFHYSLFNALDGWNQTLPALQIPWTWSMLAVPVGAALQLVHLAALILDQVAVLVGAES